MKSKFVFLILLLGLDFYSQQITHKYDKRISFVFVDKSIGGEDIVFNSKDMSTPILSRTYQWQTESSVQFINFYYKYKNQMYKMQGVGTGKYLVANSNTIYQRGNGVHYFEKVKDSLFEYGSEKGLNKWVSEVEKGVKVEMYTKKMDDGINYSTPSIHFMSSYFGLAPSLDLGEKIIYTRINAFGKTSMSNYTKVEDIDESVCIDYDELNAYLDDKHNEFSSKRQKKIKLPVFCSVVGFSSQANAKTNELIEEFLGHICDFYTVWGSRVQKDEFKKIYLAEVDRIYKLYKNHKVLSLKQVEIFKSELLESFKEY